MSENLKNILIAFLFLGLATTMTYTYFTHYRLAYVQSETLITEYKGMQEARQIFQQKQLQWQANLDTLKADYRRKEIAKAPAAQLQAMAQNIQQYAASIEQLAREEDPKMTQAVLEQINVFVEEYGQEHGYDLILGTTNAGSLLYGKEELDITEELLEALNHHYNPGSYGQ